MTAMSSSNTSSTSSSMSAHPCLSVSSENRGMTAKTRLGDIGTQTSATDNVETLKRRLLVDRNEKKRLRESMRRKKIKLDQKSSARNSNAITVKQFRAACDQHLQPHMAEVVKAQTSRKHYSQALKNLCLQFFLSSEKNYELMRKFFRLPSRKTLSKELDNTLCESGLNEKIIQSMKTKIQGSDIKKKYCTIAIDEMALKQHLYYDSKTDRTFGYSDFSINGVDRNIADHAIVMMAQGVFEKWKQPIGFNFVTSTCQTGDVVQIIEGAVRALTEAGFIVLAVISDQGATNVGACMRLIVSQAEPYFFVDGNKVYYLYDAPHLLKNTRNCLMKNVVTVGGIEVSWHFIRLFYEADVSNGSVRDAPKLTTTHINPVNQQKMKVKYAAQVFSATVASHMRHYIRNNVLEATAAHTAHFIDQFDKLFDLFNATSEQHPFKPYNNGFSGQQYQYDLLDTMYALIDSIVVTGKDGKNNTAKNKFLRGWRQNIMAIRQIWADLKDIDDVKYLPTRNLNQDGLENFFGKMRSSCGDCRMPTCYQFMCQFRRKSALNILSTSIGANCENDMGYMLLNEIYRATQETPGEHH